MQHVPAKARMHAGTGSAGVSWYGPGGSSSSSSFGNGSGGTGYATSEANTAQASSSSGSFRRTSRATSALDDNGAGPSSGAASNSGVASTSTSSTASRVARRASPSRTSQSPPSPPHRSSSLRSSTHVEAIHDFDPSIMTANASLGHNKYLSLRAGELILVQGRDPTGWWSGEVTGEDGRPRRGWFPSNYVRELELEDAYRLSEPADGSGSPRVATYQEARSRHTSIMSHTSMNSQASRASGQSYGSQSSIRGGLSQSDEPLVPSLGTPLPAAVQSVLQPVTQNLSLLQSSIQSHRRSHIQPATAEVINSMRTVLSRMSLMGRDTAGVLADRPALARERRGVLADLSRLVTCARETADLMNNEGPAFTTALDNTATAARTLFASFRLFILHAYETSIPIMPMPAEGQTSGTVPAPRQPRRASGSGSSRLKAASVSDLRGSAKRQGTSPPPPMPSSHSPHHGGVRMESTDSSRQSSPAASPSAPRRGSSTRPRRSTSFEAIAAQQTESPEMESPTVDLTESLDMPITADAGSQEARPYHNGNAVHEAVRAAEDALLSIVASFIGHIHSHHIDSHPSSHAYLIELTTETVDRVRDLLTIVENVGIQADSLGVREREVETLKVARDDLYDAASQLVEGAEAVANAPFSEAGEEAYDVEKAGLLQVTTTTLRAGTECARVVRRCVPEDGAVDSEYYDSPPLSIASTSLSGSPRRAHTGLGLGIRGHNSLQSLTRRATSLGQLHRRFQQDGVTAGVPLPHRHADSADDDDEEIVQDITNDEDTPVRGESLPGAARRPGSRPSSHPDGSGDPFDKRRSSEVTLTGAPRSRSTSLTSPATKRVGRKSPSRSADYSTETGSAPSSRPSTLVSFTSPARTSTTSQFPPSTSSSGGISDQLRAGLPDAPYVNGDSPNLPPDITLEGGKVAGFRPPSGPAPARPPPPSRSPALPLGDGAEGGDVRFWVVAHDYDPREVAFNSEGVLVGGTLRVLVEKMTPHDGTPDRNFASAFWYTFRLFTTPTELAENLIARYELKPPPVVTGMGEEQLKVWHERKLLPVQLRVYNTVKAWLELHWRPDSDNVVLDMLEAFATGTVSSTLTGTMGAMGPRLAEAVRRRKEQPVDVPESRNSVVGPTGKSSSFDRMRNSALTGMLHTPVPSSALPTPVISKNLATLLSRNPPPTAVSITDFDTLELARQLTIFESKLFQKVAPEDLLMTGKKSVPALKTLSTVSNQITGWVTDGILNEQDAKHRAALLKFYIKLADKCLMLNNFSTLFAVLAGLNSSTIHRLKKTWDVLNPKYRMVMDRIKAVIEHTKNHAAYRARLREVTGPCLPFLGLILSDITFTQDGNPNTRSSTLSPELQLINQDKFTKLGRIASDFRRYQTPFDLKEIDQVQGFLERVLAERGSGSLDALYRKSLLLEPRQGSEKLGTSVEKPGWLGARLQV